MQLMKHASEVGEYFKSRLNDLKNKHTIIGDIRGNGLFLGVDLVKDRNTREPHTKAAEHAVSRFREEKILMQRDGPFENVLKMKPPMKFSKENVELFVSLSYPTISIHVLYDALFSINFFSHFKSNFFFLILGSNTRLDFGRNRRYE